jgi:galactonate dehydratase
MIDCHSLFEVLEAQTVAHRLEPYNLAWYEEPVAPERIEDTLSIRRAIKQPIAGGEVLFGMKGFAPLCQRRSVDVIMPDVKHCGGLLEMTRIAAMAAVNEVTVAPHNPSGPVSTAASVQICAGMINFRILELQWGEIGWRSQLVTPEERFHEGAIHVPERSGFGIQLNDRVARSHPI